MSARSYVIKSGKQRNIEVTEERGVVRVFLHGNLIVEKRANTITLSSCGWHTRTTFRAINRFLRLYNLPTVVKHCNGEMKVVVGEDYKPFYDGVKIKPTGEL